MGSLALVSGRARVLAPHEMIRRCSGQLADIETPSPYRVPSASGVSGVRASKRGWTASGGCCCEAARRESQRVWDLQEGKKGPNLQVGIHDNHLLTASALKAAQDGRAEALLVRPDEQLDVVSSLPSESLDLLDRPVLRIVIDDDDLSPGGIANGGEDGFDERGEVVAFVVRGDDDRAVDLVVVDRRVGAGVPRGGGGMVQARARAQEDERGEERGDEDGGEVGRREHRVARPETHGERF